MARLSGYVVVHNDATNQSLVVGPNDELPEWAEDAITNPKAWAEPPAGDGYAGQKVADLKAEIARRNEGRDEADRLSADGKKADLVAVLEADDASK